MKTLTDEELNMVEAGIEIAFMQIKEIIDHPEMIQDIPDQSHFFHVYLKREGQEALLLGVRPKAG